MQKREKKYIVNQTSDLIHTGDLLSRYYKDLGTKKSALARDLNRRPETIYKYQKNATIQTAILWEISVALKHNFFKDIACRLPAEFTSYESVAPIETDKVVDLEQQILKLTIERDILLKAMGQMVGNNKESV